jgi:hypothetical protein
MVASGRADWSFGGIFDIIEKFLGFFFAEHQRAGVALADKMDFGCRSKLYSG